MQACALTCRCSQVFFSQQRHCCDGLRRTLGQRIDMCVYIYIHTHIHTYVHTYAYVYYQHVQVLTRFFLQQRHCCDGLRRTLGQRVGLRYPEKAKQGRPCAEHGHQVHVAWVTYVPLRVLCVLTYVGEMGVLCMYLL
jgi:hypothetical protein